jgi:hypothetical protein
MIEQSRDGSMGVSPEPFFIVFVQLSASTSSALATGNLYRSHTYVVGFRHFGTNGAFGESLPSEVM